MRFNPNSILPIAQSELGREPECATKTNGYRLTMYQTRAVISNDALKRMRKGVAKVEKCAIAILAFIAHHDCRFRFTRNFNRMNAIRTTGKNASMMRF
jgi:hypothetical protein